MCTYFGTAGNATGLETECQSMNCWINFKILTCWVFKAKKMKELNVFVAAWINLFCWSDHVLLIEKKKSSESGHPCLSIPILLSVFIMKAFYYELCQMLFIFASMKMIVWFFSLHSVDVA